ncbi:methyl-accepting chemotaxis protein [Asticcacaulis sp.]|uniref:methyl-accepting chemotaxis protein n=1 Tax=Asticcacaulis sp. TaxID=1872648 RepID=UPI0031E0D3E9
MRTIRARLQGVIIVLIVGALLSCGLAFLIAEAGRKGLQTVYADRVIPLEQLKGISDDYAVSIVDNAHKVRAGTVSFEDGVRRMDEALKHSDGLFDAYMLTYMDDNEKALAQAAKEQKDKAKASIAQLRDIMVRKDQIALETYVSSELYPSIDPVTAAFDVLVKLQVSEAKKSFDKASISQTRFLWGVGLALFINAVLGIIGIWIVRHRVILPINRLTDVMSRLANGEYQTEVPGREARNEIGEMARAVEVFKANGLERQRLEAAEKEELAQREARARVIEGLVQRFDAQTRESIQFVSVAATELEASAESLTSGAEETTRQSTTVSSASEEASMNVQTVAAATEEMSATVQEIARQVQGSVHIARTAMAEARRSSEVVHKLSDGAERIGGFVNLITQVASQTNLLALNATIEAARAGEAGKGFAVVASEVKTLAQQTSKASADIEAQVLEIRTVVAEAVEAIDQIQATIDQMSEVSTAISAAVDEQYVTTQEIARNVQEASQSTVAVAQNMSGISRATEETTVAATQVLSASGELSRQADTLRKDVHEFISGVRAA